MLAIGVLALIIAVLLSVGLFFAAVISVAFFDDAVPRIGAPHDAPASDLRINADATSNDVASPEERRGADDQPLTATRGELASNTAERCSVCAHRVLAVVLGIVLCATAAIAVEESLTNAPISAGEPEQSKLPGHLRTRVANRSGDHGGKQAAAVATPIGLAS
jgi:hypothetical protein